MKRYSKFLFMGILIIATATILMSNSSCPCCSAFADDSAKVAANPENGGIKDVNANKLPRLLDLGAKKCIPCKKMAPILEELTKEYKGIFDVEFIDVWEKENAKKAEAYKIESIPVQIFFGADGKELWRHEGFFSKEDILSKWKELGVKIPQNNDK